MLLSSCEYYNVKKVFSITKVCSQVHCTGKIVSPCNNFSSNLISIEVSGSDLLILLAVNSWGTLTPMNHIQYNFRCVSHSNCIYVFGRFISIGVVSNTAKQINIDSKQ